MNNELAKHLKRTGFKFDWCPHEEHNSCSPDFPCYPNLAELIDACGKDFYCLIKDEKDGWVAQGKNMQYKHFTKEDAVAGLWLFIKS